MSPAKTYTLKEVAAAIGCHYITVMKAVNRGEIRASRIGRLWLIPESEYLRLTQGGELANEPEHEPEHEY